MTTLLQPASLLPLLALVFAALALWRRMSEGDWRGAARTWGLLALMFGAVSLWLHLFARA